MKEKSLVEKIQFRLKNNRVIAYVVVIFVVLGSVLKFTNDFFTLRKNLKSEITNNTESSAIDTIKTDQKEPQPAAEDQPRKLEKIVPVKSFSIQQEFGFLSTAIKEATGYQFSKNGNGKNVSFSYSGKIQEVKNGLHRFPGGTLLLLIDGKECDIGEYPIERTFMGGNELSFVEGEIKKQIINIVSDNRATIVGSISNCIK